MNGALNRLAAAALPTRARPALAKKTCVSVVVFSVFLVLPDRRRSRRCKERGGRLAGI